MIEFIKEKKMVIIVAAVIAAIGIYTIVYAPILSKLSTKKKECLALEAALSDSRNVITEFLKKGAVKKELGEEKEVTFLVGEITRQGKEKGLSFISVAPKSIVESDAMSHRVLPVEVIVESSYSELGEFLGSLDDLEKGVVTIAGFKIVPRTPSPSRLRSELLLHLHLKKQAS